MTIILNTMTVRTIAEERRWQAVEERDAAYDGVFVTAVRSTGIYCRPSCPARRPARDRVVFFETPDEAEAAGFRACLRCDPRGEKPDRRALVRDICSYLDAEIESAVTLDALGSRFGVSRYHLQRTFKRVMGVTPHQYAAARKVERLKGELRNGRDVTGALYAAGYGSSSRLYECAPSVLGMTPRAYGRGGRGMRIAYVTVDCALGRMLVGATDRGVCCVKLGDRDEDLEAALRSEYPAAEIGGWGGGKTEGLLIWVELLLKHVERGQPSVNLPLDIQVTAFQSRVYSALRSIANGQTRSYSEIAREIGEPRGARAVARACATNPVAVTVPCHRVIRDNGDLGGYGGGVERKRELLATEARAASGEPAFGEPEHEGKLTTE